MTAHIQYPVTGPSSNRALLTTRSGDGLPTPGIEALVAELGYEPVDSLSQERSEHNRYSIGPGLVDRLADRIEADRIELLAVDQLLHPGQLLDLTERLPPVTVRDRRGVVRSALAEAGNPTAALLDRRQRTRIHRRSVAREQRSADTASPEGTDSRLDDLDTSLEQLDDRIQSCTEKQRRRVHESHSGADGFVVVTGEPNAALGSHWQALTGEQLDGTTALGPATPTTARAEIGGHDIAVTATTAILPNLPEWYERTVPGTVAALSRADVIVSLTGDDRRPDWTERFATGADATVLTVDSSPERHGPDPTAGSLQDRVAGALPTERLQLSLPMSDDSMAIVAWCHDTVAVDSIEYGDRITITVDVRSGRIRELKERVRSVDGSVQ